jgi:asparagine synthase (glutamine-hydrolysing)
LSGIAAVLNFDGSAVPHSEVERLASVLGPYGPDGQKTLLRGNAAFVFCLHHLTPEDLFERQPLLIADRFALLFDGRIDNRPELSGTLGIATPELALMPDSVMASRLFDRWGERAFEWILGDFAIIVMDLKDRRLICVRDHMGQRVLHYHHSFERFAVATIPEALFALGWVPRILNKDQVGDTLINSGLNGEITYYKGIYRVLPGSFIRVGAAGLSKHRFWDPENIGDVRFKSDHEYVEAFQEHLNAAVKVRLRSLCAPCAQITGGLDSSSIAVIAADMLATNGNKLDTYTAVPEAGFLMEETRGSYFDETPYVRQIARANANIVPHFVVPTNGPLLEQIFELVRMAGFPPANVFNCLWVMNIHALARSAGHNVMLTGEMGNLTMSYNGSALLAELLLTGRWWRLFSEITASGDQWRYMLRSLTIAPFIPAALFRQYKQWRRGGCPPWHGFSAIHPEFAARSGVVARAAREYSAFDTPPPRNGRLDRIRAFTQYCETADWFAKLRANFGIDNRTPAFDRRLVEFCIGIPQDQYLRKGHDRWLIRRAMQGRLPESVLSNKKRGAQSADWFPRLMRERHRIAAELERLAGNSDVASIVDLQRLTAILDDRPGHGAQKGPILPQALGAAYFIENATDCCDYATI